RSSDHHENVCTGMPARRPETDGSVQIPGFDRIGAANDDFSYDPRFGLLATDVTRRGGCLTAVGPGAGVAAADETGRVNRYIESTAELDPAALTACPVPLIDAGAVPDAPASPAAFLSPAARPGGPNTRAPPVRATG